MSVNFRKLLFHLSFPFFWFTFLPILLSFFGQLNPSSHIWKLRLGIKTIVCHIQTIFGDTIFSKCLDVLEMEAVGLKIFDIWCYWGGIYVFLKRIFVSQVFRFYIFLFCLILFKVGLSPSKKICVIYVTESPLKTMKNAFYFILKAFFVIKIFMFLSWLFGHVGKSLD